MIGLRRLFVLCDLRPWVANEVVSNQVLFPLGADFLILAEQFLGAIHHGAYCGHLKIPVQILSGNIHGLSHARLPFWLELGHAILFQQLISFCVKARLGL